MDFYGFSSGLYGFLKDIYGYLPCLAEQPDHFMGTFTWEIMWIYSDMSHKYNIILWVCLKRLKSGMPPKMVFY